CGPKSYPVSGKVTMKDGSLLTPDNTIIFEPASIKEKENRFSSRGRIGPDGTFRLSTSREGDGIPAGKYRALLAPPPLIAGNANQMTWRIPFDMKYQEFDTSGLVFDVGPGSTEFNIALDPNPGFKK